MHGLNRSTRRRLIFAICCLVAFRLTGAPRPNPEQIKIERLLRDLELSGATFIRNGGEYDSAKAAAHLRAKLSKAGDRIRTAREFVDLVASKSSQSGAPYQLRLPGESNKIPVRDWLMKKLDALEARIENSSESK